MTNKEQIIEALLTRSTATLMPKKELLQKKLLESKRLRIYCGFDPTAPQLHIGHSTNLIMLEKFRQLGHEVIMLFGDFTAMIGDPTDKMATRVALTREQVTENIASWKEQVSHILDFEDKENPAKIVHNSDWWGNMKFDEVISIAGKFTVQQMMERDMFEKRMQEGKPIHLHEFLYPLAQGYDSVAMDVDIEVGGNDQTFNMLAGRTLQKKYNNKEKFVIGVKLVANPLTGKKLMSKSEGNCIWLNDDPINMYGKTMSLPDEVVPECFTHYTFLSLDEIADMEAQVKNGANMRDIKMKLGRELVTMYHSTDDAQRAEQNFIAQFQKKAIPDDLPEFKQTGTHGILSILTNTLEFTKSNGEARRKVSEGAVQVDGEKITDPQVEIDLSTKPEWIIKLGKKMAKILS